MTHYLFKWKHFKSEIILLCVRWYLKYPLSYRRLVEMMQERGLNITHTTIMRWVHQYSPIIDEKIRKYLKPMLGFGSFNTAELTICGIEVFHMIRKGQVEEIQCVLSEVKFINKIMGVVA